ncbi:hypothetical protein EVAR_71257_1 [Eumeta japonica]|uniref:Uncharacterized protein n=1 Tax=Eumeta variegata TaxID=151549 RepID=A0A4C1TF23_EUMVA|nr:hypothetical protein EVAR_71257_1 [Eumeta japonica]
MSIFHGWMHQWRRRPARRGGRGEAAGGGVALFRLIRRSEFLTAVKSHGRGRGSAGKKRCVDLRRFREPESREGPV